jgi:hypothetical protein
MSSRLGSRRPRLRGHGGLARASDPNVVAIAEQERARLACFGTRGDSPLPEPDCASVALHSCLLDPTSGENRVVGDDVERAGRCARATGRAPAFVHQNELGVGAAHDGPGGAGRLARGRVAVPALVRRGGAHRAPWPHVDPASRRGILQERLERIAAARVLHGTGERALAAPDAALRLDDDRVHALPFRQSPVSRGRRPMITISVSTRGPTTAALCDAANPDGEVRCARTRAHLRLHGTTFLDPDQSCKANLEMGAARPGSLAALCGSPASLRGPERTPRGLRLGRRTPRVDHVRARFQVSWRQPRHCAHIKPRNLKGKSTLGLTGVTVGE